MRTRVVLSVAVAVSVLAVGWWFLVPAALGGRASYVVTHGVSMQPRFHTGDLAVVYPHSGYRVGDIAAYHSNLLHTTVLHRIIATNPDGYAMKGDNNSWRDPEHPTADQMVGRLGVRIPRGGVVLGWIHHPLVAGVLAVAITTMGATGTVGLRRRRRRRARAGTRAGARVQAMAGLAARARVEGAPMSLHHLHATSRRRPANAVLAGAVGLMFAGLLGATYLVPGQIMHAHKLRWTSQVSYTYTARIAPSVVYPDGQVAAGQTVFRKLVNRLTVRTTWSLHTTLRHHLEGTARLQAVVHGPDGWTHPIDLGPEQVITADRVSLTSTVDLAATDAVIKRAADLTGIPTDNYTVSLQPLVKLSGSVAGQPLDFAAGPPEPALTLAVTPNTVILTVGATSTPGAAGDAKSSTAVGGTTSPGQALTPGPSAHTTTINTPGAAVWRVLGHPVPVTFLRWAGLAGTTLALLALIVLLLARPGTYDPCARATRRHRGSIITVNRPRIGPADNVLDVASMTSLAQVAQRYDRLILQPASTPGVYLVEDETGLYRYQCPHHDHHPHPNPHPGPRQRRHLAERAGAQGPVSESA